MKILVLSDSHGCLSHMVKAVERVQPHMIFHLGDCREDARKLNRAFPAIPMESVPGNNDYFCRDAAERVVVLEEKRIFFCHGHTRRVKQTLYDVMLAAQEQDAHIALFGHTHRIFCENRNGLFMLNPGAIGDFGYPTFGVLELVRGEVLTSTMPLDGYPR